MDREIDMKEVSDGKLYGLRDMVRADCGGCEGCCECCRGMGSSIVLDPYDIYHLTTGLNRSFEDLLKEEKIELNLAEGIVLPNLKMAGQMEQCGFLNGDGNIRFFSTYRHFCYLHVAYSAIFLTCEHIPRHF